MACPMSCSGKENNKNNKNIYTHEPLKATRMHRKPQKQAFLPQDPQVNRMTRSETHDGVSIRRVHAHCRSRRTLDPWNGVERLADVNVEDTRRVRVLASVLVRGGVVPAEVDQRTQVYQAGFVPNRAPHLKHRQHDVSAD